MLAARDRFEAALGPDWRRPVRFGVGLLLPGAEAAWYPYVCHGDHPLPAAVLATVCGHAGAVAEAASYELTDAELDEAISLLAPAGACPDFDHPNLAAWRTVRSLRETVEATIVAAFDADPPPPTDDPALVGLRRPAPP